ncbi:sugar-binding transcriptional regulator [Actinomyces minihominis]|uniref:sugar-binding transcriptional regulator n=1 Tax=Actinomyces minihominis TaxID=2002838 RepID=UPI001F5D35F0
MYYEQGLTMDAVARRLDVSRSSVSRLLAFARTSGIVQIRVSAPLTEPGTLSAEFQRLFGVRTLVVPTLDVDSPATRLNAVASVAASRLTELMGPNKTLGVAWGNTVSAVIKHIAPHSMPGSTVVQLNGAANAFDSGTLYSDSIISALATTFDSSAVHFPVPAFFDYVETKEALNKERSIRRVLDVINSCDIALFGVGAMDPAMPSHVYAGGYLSASELREAREDGVVGDVCTVLIREDGSTDMPLNARASGPIPSQLKRIPTRLCVVSGSAKVPALLGALRSGVPTDLIIDSSAARALMQRLREKGRSEVKTYY